MANPNDAIREQILRYFYDRNAKATSRFGKKGSAVKTSAVKKELKALHGLTQQQVVANLNYLIDRGWVEEISKAKQFNPGGGRMSVTSETLHYQITADGIDRIEGGSQFEPKDRFEGININASGHNVITLGDGNTIRVEYRDLHTELMDLRKQVVASDELDEEVKFAVAVDIDAITDQLANPDSTIVERSWRRVVDALSAASGLATIIEKIGPLIGPLIALGSG